MPLIPPEVLHFTSTTPPGTVPLCFVSAIYARGTRGPLVRGLEPKLRNNIVTRDQVPNFALVRGEIYIVICRKLLCGKKKHLAKYI